MLPENHKTGPDWPHGCTQRLQTFRRSLKKPPVGWQFFYFLIKIETTKMSSKISRNSYIPMIFLSNFMYHLQFSLQNTNKTCLSQLEKTVLKCSFYISQQDTFFILMTLNKKKTGLTENLPICLRFDIYLILN